MLRSMVMLCFVSRVKQAGLHDTVVSLTAGSVVGCALLVCR